jgi:Asp-tRNA(Asn)/Glu-tRNA(Gln) amidotransferase A subunit family amidase
MSSGFHSTCYAHRSHHDSAFESYFLQAQLIRQQLKADFDAVLQPSVLGNSDSVKSDAVDFIMYPSAVSTAPALGGESSQLSEYAQDVLNVPASLAGLPACSIPFGTCPAGWPIGVQIASAWGSDAPVLALAEMLEAARPGRPTRCARGLLIGAAAAHENYKLVIIGTPQTPCRSLPNALLFLPVIAWRAASTI